MRPITQADQLIAVHTEHAIGKVGLNRFAYRARIYGLPTLGSSYDFGVMILFGDLPLTIEKVKITARSFCISEEMRDIGRLFMSKVEDSVTRQSHLLRDTLRDNQRAIGEVYSPFYDEDDDD